MDIEKFLRLEELDFNQLQQLKNKVDYFYNKAKQGKIESLIIEFAEMDEEELRKLIKTYKRQLKEAKNNKEYDYIAKRLKIGNAVLITK